MSVTRREVIRILAASVAVPLIPGCTDGKGDDTGTPQRSPEPDPWAAPGADDPTVFPTGIQTGDATSSSVILSVRTDVEEVTLVVMRGDGEEWVEVVNQAVTCQYGGVWIELGSLVADTPYAIAVYADADRRTPVARVRTAATERRVVTFGATSCLGDAAPEQPALATVPGEALDFFCLLGDFVYADGARTGADYTAYYVAQMQEPTVRAALASTSVVATWDDHELKNNWSWDDIDQAWYDAALASFRTHIPQGRGPSEGIWRQLSWGPTLDVFVLDCRSERIDGRYISVAQMDWLKAALSASAARFKVILTSVPITDLSPIFGEVEADDRWQGFPEQRAEILEHIESEGVTGVLWIGGDVHHAQIGHVDPPGGTAADQWEVFVGPSGSTPNVLVDLATLDDQFLWLSSAWNWAKFACDPDEGHVTVTFYGPEGSVIEEMVLTL